MLVSLTEIKVPIFISKQDSKIRCTGQAVKLHIHFINSSKSKNIKYMCIRSMPSKLTSMQNLSFLSRVKPSHKMCSLLDYIHKLCLLMLEYIVSIITIITIISRA